MDNVNAPDSSTILENSHLGGCPHAVASLLRLFFA